MWEEFIMLFTDMGIISLVFIICGIVFTAIEICIPGFGVFGVLGIICVVCGIIARALEGASITQISIMVLICLIVFVLTFVVISHSLHKGLLSKTGLVENGQVLEKDYVSPYTELVGKIGETIGVCRPSGSVKIGEEMYDCVSEKDYIEPKTKVVVTQIKDDKIYVKVLEDKIE